MISIIANITDFVNRYLLKRNRIIVMPKAVNLLSITFEVLSRDEPLLYMYEHRSVIYVNSYYLLFIRQISSSVRVRIKSDNSFKKMY